MFVVITRCNLNLHSVLVFVKFRMSVVATSWVFVSHVPSGDLGTSGATSTSVKDNEGLIPPTYYCNRSAIVI